MSFWPGILAIAGRLDQTSYYELLGVAPDAGGDAIVARYYDLAGRLHPDRHGRGATAEQLAALNKVHARLGEARRILTNPALRAEYDRRQGDGVQRLDAAQQTRRPKPVAKDPANPMARQLYEQALAMIDAKDEARARTTLGLAKQYEPNSPAIAAALERVTPKRAAPAPAPAAAPAPAPAPVPVTPAPAPAPVAAAPPPAPVAAAPPPSPAPAPAARATAAPPPASVAPTRPLQPTPRPTPRTAPPPDARAAPRREVAMPIKLKLPTWKHLEVLVSRDLSRGGLFLRSNKPLEPGARVDLVLEPPAGDPVTLEAEVVRAVAPGGDEPAGMGLRFLDVPAEALVALDRLLTGHSD
jgi:uncharacterized protein (TIGR02266 family)